MMFCFAKRGAEALVVRTIVAAGVDTNSVSVESSKLAVQVGMSYAVQGYDRVGVIVAADLQKATTIAKGGNAAGFVLFGCDQADAP